MENNELVISIDAEEVDDAVFDTGPGVCQSVYCTGMKCQCGGDLVSFGLTGVAETESPTKIINSVTYLSCEDCGKDYAFRTVLEEINLSKVLSEEEY